MLLMVSMRLGTITYNCQKTLAEVTTSIKTVSNLTDLPNVVGAILKSELKSWSMPQPVHS